MVGEYKGHFSYDKIFVNLSAPISIGIYYMGAKNPNGKLGVTYIGRALGENVTIKSRLLDHLNKNEWPDVKQFGYKVCSTQKEVEDLEKVEILRLHPSHNQKIG